MDSAKDDLREARDHARHALTATLRAMRTALDTAISRLEGATPRESAPPAGDPPRPGDTFADDGDKVQ